MRVDDGTSRRRHIYVSSSFVGGINSVTISARRVCASLSDDRARLIIDGDIADSEVEGADTVARRGRDIAEIVDDDVAIDSGQRKCRRDNPAWRRAKIAGDDTRGRSPRARDRGAGIDGCR